MAADADGLWFGTCVPPLWINQILLASLPPLRIEKCLIGPRPLRDLLDATLLRIYVDCSDGGQQG